MSRYWFKPKRYGYGATPITWEGWVFTLMIVLVILGSGWLMLGTTDAPRGATKVWVWWAIVMVVLATSVAVTKAKTEGGWRWRWGRD